MKVKTSPQTESGVITTKHPQIWSETRAQSRTPPHHHLVLSSVTLSSGGSLFL